MSDIAGRMDRIAERAVVRGDPYGMQSCTDVGDEGVDTEAGDGVEIPAGSIAVESARSSAMPERVRVIRTSEGNSTEECSSEVKVFVSPTGEATSGAAERALTGEVLCISLEILDFLDGWVFTVGQVTLSSARSRTPTAIEVEVRSVFCTDWPSFPCDPSVWDCIWRSFIAVTEIYGVATPWAP